MNIRSLFYGARHFWFGLAIFSSAVNAGPVGDPFRVNLYVEGGQETATVAMGVNGDSVVLFRDGGRGGNMFMQRYDNAGRALQGDDWVVGGPGVMDAAVDGRGNFVIVKSETDGAGGGIFALVYDRLGNILVPQFRVNDTVAGDQGPASVAMNANGEFVIAWTSVAPGVSPGVYIKRYRLNGTPLGAEVRASDPAYSSQYVMDVAIDGFANSVVTWYSQVPQSNLIDVWARRFNSAGNPLAPQFRANTYTADVQIGNAVAMNASGNFIIVWESYGQDGADWGVYAQRYNSAGTPLGGEFRVNTTTTGSQQFADVGMDASGNFVVTWTHDNYVNDPTSPRLIFARHFNANGTPRGDEFLVSTTPNSINAVGKIGMDDQGNYLIGWRFHDKTTGQDDAYARRYIPDTPPVTTLLNGQSVSNLSGAAYSWRYFKITVPTGYPRLDISMNGPAGSGDADLYVRYGALPTLTAWDGRPYVGGNNEAVYITNPRAGDWYIGLYGYSSYLSVGLRAYYY